MPWSGTATLSLKDCARNVTPSAGMARAQMPERRRSALSIAGWIFDSFSDRLREGLMVGHPDMPTFRFTREDARGFVLYLIESTVGQRETLSSATDFMTRIYFSLIDCMLVELNDRLSSKTLELMKSISTVYPESENFLNISEVEEFSRHIDTDSNAPKNEFVVIKSMLQSKTVADVIEFLNELIPLSTAILQTLQTTKSPITMPISQMTCERSFSKMKIIKNYLRNSISDQRSSDLILLAIERDFHINYERVIDKFSSNHKNCRILLR